MATTHLPDEFFDLVSHHLPPEPPPTGPQGGRPRIAYRVAVRVIWFVLVSGCRWEDVPRELGCSGRTAHRRLRLWEELGVWDRVHADLLGLLKRAGKLDFDMVIVDMCLCEPSAGARGPGQAPSTGGNPGQSTPCSWIAGVCH